MKKYLDFVLADLFTQRFGAQVFGQRHAKARILEKQKCGLFSMSTTSLFIDGIDLTGMTYQYISYVTTTCFRFQFDEINFN